MAAAASSMGVKPNITSNKKSIQVDVKEHVDGCACDKCVYFPVTPVAKSVQDGKAVGMVPSVSVKGLMRGAQRKGMAPFRVRRPYSFALSCAAGGICSGTQPVTADANAAEWAAWLELYDEFRVLGGLVEYGSTYQTPAGANTVDAMFSVLGFDPVDGTALSSVRKGTELSQHHLRMACATNGWANSVNVSMAFQSANARPHRFKFSLAPMKAFVANNTLVSFAPGQWKSMNTAGNNTPDGYLKFYGTSDNANVVTCVTGILYLDVEFRAFK